MVVSSLAFLRGTYHRTLRAFSQQRQEPLPVLVSDLYYRSTRSTRSTRLTRSTISTRPDSRDKISSPRHRDPDRDPDGDRDGDCDRHQAKSARAPPGQIGSPVPTRWSCRSTGTDHDQDQMITIPQICYTSANFFDLWGDQDTTPPYRFLPGLGFPEQQFTVTHSFSRLRLQSPGSQDLIRAPLDLPDSPAESTYWTRPSSPSVQVLVFSTTMRQPSNRHLRHLTIGTTGTSGTSSMSLNKTATRRGKKMNPSTTSQSSLT